MRSYLGAPLFYIFTLLAVVSAVEFHAGHEAVHQTALWKRSKVQADNARKEAMINMSTKISDQGSEYIGTIGVGTDSEGNALFQARVVFDTGSTNLWVASHLCKESNDGIERAKQYYDPAKSLTQEEFVQHNKNDIDIHFGTGELIGPMHVDTYRVGPMEVKKQPFAMIRTMNGGVFHSFPFEGILGLGFRDMSFAGVDPFFDRVIEQKLLINNEFAFYMNVDSNKPSAILWGGIDKDLYHGQIVMFPVVQPHYWSLELLDFKLGNTSMKDFGGKAPLRHLIVDTGTTYFTAPSRLNDALMEQLPDGDCKKAKNYPDLTFVLKGADGEPYDLVVTQETYMLGGAGDDYCSPAFMSLDVAAKFGPAILLGEVFMRHFFTVFSRGDGDVKNAKVGFAPANLGQPPKVKDSATQTAPAFLQKEAPHDLMRRSPGSESIGVDSRAHLGREIQQHQ